jgi:uncharacterized membrane protein (DUF4010 family)
MLGQLSQYLPSEGMKILIVLFLSFLIGLEREEHKAEAEHYSFGGVRTFPLIGLVGYVMALLSGGQLLPLSIGFAVVGSFLLMSYRHKLLSQQGEAEAPGVTTEISGLGTYLLGALVYQGHYWIAATIAVISLLLLELKEGLEGLSKRIAPQEILTLTKFLLLTAVILPILPNTDFTQYRINPFKTWLVVVAVSGISYGSYVLLSLTRQKSGVILSAVLGGAYSSTATTVALAKRSVQGQQPHLFSGAILLASAMMYVRLTVLLMFFSRSLLVMLAAPLMILACLAGLAGWLWSRVPSGGSARTKREFQPRNPLELRAAVLFAALFLAVLVVTRVAVTRYGNAGIYSLAALVGLMDVDPFILGMTQSAGALATPSLAASGILIAASSNNMMKGIYAYTFADRKTGLQSLALLTTLSAMGLVPLWFLIR